MVKQNEIKTSIKEIKKRCATVGDLKKLNKDIQQINKQLNKNGNGKKEKNNKI